MGENNDEFGSDRCRTYVDSLGIRRWMDTLESEDTVKEDRVKRQFFPIAVMDQ